MDYGVPLGHRFRALKLWFVMRYFGRERIAQTLRAHIEWAQKFAELVDNDAKFERVAPVPFSVVCFRYQGTDEQNLAIEEKVNQTGRIFISHTALNGRIVLRMAIGNLGTTWSDVEEAWRLIKESAG
jgi:aromatic-L-amino-acid decarboxylase